MKRIIILMSVLMFFSTIGTAQSNLTEKEKYDAGMKAALKKIGDTPYRRKTIEQEYSKKVVTTTCHVIEEFLSKDANRLSRSSVTPNPRCHYHRVKVNGYLYEKKGTEDWSKTKLDSDGNPSGDRVSKWGDPIETRKLHEYLITPGELNREKVTIYLHYEVFEMNGLLYFLMTYDWVNSEGYLVRNYRRVSHVLPESIDRDYTMTYEYNPKDLKIEAPIK